MIKFSLNGSEFFLVAKDSNIFVQPKSMDNEDATVKISQENFLKLINGATSGKSLFMKGDMKISGDMSKMMKLDTFTQALVKLSTTSKL